MTSEEFQKLIVNCQPSELYNPDWSLYYPFSFVNNLLPAVKLRVAKDVKVYDGAELFANTQKTEPKQYKLTDSKHLISIVGFTYPKGAEAEKQRKNVIASDHEVCVFMEVAQDDSIEVFFKLGRDFKEFLHSYSKQSKKPINPTVVESTTYKTDIKALKAVFNKKLVHYNLIEFILKTIGINETKTFQNNYEAKLQSLLAANKIEGIVYANVLLQNDKKQYVTIAVKQGSQGLNYGINTTDKKPHGQQPEKYVAVKKAGAAPPLTFVTDTAKPLAAPPVTQSEDGKPQPDNEALKQVYTELTKAGFTENHAAKNGNEFDLTEIAQAVANQLANPFYKDVKMSVRILQLGKAEASKPADAPKKVDGISIPSLQTNSNQIPQVAHQAIIQTDTEWEVGVDIVIDEKGKVAINHRISENYLKESKYWQNEIEQRGLSEEVKLDDLRQQITADFESEETEKDFYDKFIQDVKATFSNKIAGYVEGIQATQKVAKNVWEAGTINESLWLTKTPEHKEWPEYMHTNSLLGGAVDGVIDEIVGIPMAIKSVYEIATDEQKRNGFLKLFSKDGFSALVEGLKEEVRDTYQDNDKLQHFGGQTTISVASMFLGGGLFSKGKKINEVLEKTTDGLETVTDPKAYRIIDDLKKIERHVDIEKGIKEFAEQAGEDFIIESADEITDIVVSEGKKVSLEIWKQLRERGQAFNKKVKNLDPNPYLNHEVTIEHPTLKYKSGPKAGQPQIFRVDSYTHGSVIVERKATDFDKIKLKTFEGYLQSIKRKYPEGAKIVANDKEIRGLSLEGKYKIEVPKSNETSKRLKEFQDLANSEKYKIEIVFIDE